MSVNGVGPQSNGYGPHSSGSGPGSTVKRLLGSDNQNTTLPQLWQDRALIWGSRSLMGDTISGMRSVTGDSSSMGSSTANKTRAANLGFDLNEGVIKEGYTYSHIFKLGEAAKPMQLSRPSWSKFKNAFAYNWDKMGKMGERTSGFTLDRYFKETVYEANTQPIKEMIQNPNRANLGPGIAQSVGFGLMGWDVFKTTRSAYRQAKAQEDGTLSSKISTLATTGMAFAKASLRAAVSWEVAGAALAFAQRLVPIAIGRTPIGGIIVSALAGAAAYKGMSLLMDMDHKTQHSNNPFKQAGIPH